MDLTTINPMLLFGAAGFAGAGVRGLIAFYKAKKEDPKLVFDSAVFIDTAAKGVGAGVSFSLGLPITYVALGITALASAGVDTFFNKFGIKITPMLRDIAMKSVKKSTAKKKK